MKKNIFSNYFYICLITVIACISVVGLVLIAASTRLYKEEKFNEVSNIAELYISDIQSEFEENGSIASSGMQRLNYTFNNYYGITLLVYNDSGKCVLYREDKYKESTISDEMKKKLEAGEYLDFNSDKISAEQPLIYYGSRFYVQSGEQDTQRSYLVAYGSVENIDNFSSMLLLFGASVIVLIAVIAGFIFLVNTRRMSKPIAEITRITDNYAKGDFSEQIKLSGSKEMRHLASSLNEMGDFIKTNDDVSKNFIANVSHELRTPMTTIGGFVDGILDGTIPKSKQNQYLVLVSQEIKRLRILVSSMLNMTKFESGTMKPNFTEINLTDTVISTVLMFEKKIEDKNLEIDGLDSERLMVVADKDLMQQVIYNLVENAVKFVNKGGTISFAFNEIDKFAYVSIKNTGEGLKNDELSQVFDRFYKTDSSRGKDTTGLGLGLAISRKIIHLHNGQIIVKSVYNEYTEFTIKIPVKQ